MNHTSAHFGNNDVFVPVEDRRRTYSTGLLAMERNWSEAEEAYGELMGTIRLLIHNSRVIAPSRILKESTTSCVLPAIHHDDLFWVSVSRWRSSCCLAHGLDSGSSGWVVHIPKLAPIPHVANCYLCKYPWWMVSPHVFQLICLPGLLDSNYFPGPRLSSVLLGKTN